MPGGPRSGRCTSSICGLRRWVARAVGMALLDWGYPELLLSFLKGIRCQNARHLAFPSSVLQELHPLCARRCQPATWIVDSPSFLRVLQELRAATSSMAAILNAIDERLKRLEVAVAMIESTEEQQAQLAGAAVAAAAAQARVDDAVLAAVEKTIDAASSE